MPSLFFEPIHLNFQSPYLTVKFILFLFGILGLLLATLTEDVDRPLKQLLLPCVNLPWLYSVFRGYLVKGSVPFQRLYSYFGLELRCVRLAHYLFPVMQ